MINKFINYLIAVEVITSDDYEIYSYGMFVVLFNLICVANIIFIGFLFRDIEYSLLFLILFTPLRILLGGFHCKTPIQCVLFFDTLFIITYFLSYFFDSLLVKIILIMIMFFIIIKYNLDCPNIRITILLDIILFLILIFGILDVIDFRIILSAIFTNIILVVLK